VQEAPVVAAEHGEGPPRPDVAVPGAEFGTGSDAPVEAVGAAPAVLAGGVRSRVLELAAEALADMAGEDVPASLRRFRSFTPARRARLAARPLSAALAADQAFRRRVGEWVRDKHAALVTALEAYLAGDPLTLSPDVAAAVAYLLDEPKWEALAGLASEEQQRAAEMAAGAAASGLVDRLRDQLETLGATAKAEAQALRQELAGAQERAEQLRRRLRSSADRVRQAEEQAAATVAEARAGQAGAEQKAAEASRDVERLRVRLAEAELAAEGLRRGTREARAVDDVRLRVLIDTLTSAAAGIRRELALPPVLGSPAELVADALAGRRADPLAGILTSIVPDEPMLLDRVLAAPGVHLIVDGYNVTKSGYGGLPLEAQRARLLAGLGAVAARVPGAEITCVFDGAQAVARPAASLAPRGVRLLFSPVGHIADELIVGLVREEPLGRAVLVVTSDHDLSEAVQRSGARVIPSATLLARLDRG
jgi:predicted RNA-binding protein with PIN domain